MPEPILDTGILEELALKADRLILANDHENIKLLIEPFLKTEYAFESLLSEAYYHYILGNCFKELYSYHKLDWFSDDLSRAVISFRKALIAINKITSPTVGSMELQSRIETHLGNTLSSQGRAFCCIPLFDSAIKKDNPVPIISKAQNEIFIANSLYDNGHKEYHGFVAYKLILSGLQQIDRLDPENQLAFSKDSDLMNHKAWFEKTFAQEAFDYFESYKMDFKSSEHESYLKWCGDNRLFINDLDDVTTSEIAYQDVLALPSITRKFNNTLSISEELAYHGNFDELKDEYCYARYLVFTAKDIPHDQIDLFNSENSHVNDMTYTITNLKSHHYKSAFKTLYSLFDKIAYFIHRFFDLNTIDNDHKISFDSIFRDLSVRGKWEPNKKLKDSENHFLHALFYILKDIRDVKEQTPVSRWLDPDALAFSKVRNAIEHRSLKIVDDLGYEMIQFNKEHNKKNIDKLLDEIKALKVESKHLAKNIALAKKEKNGILELELKAKQSLLLESVQLKEAMRDEQKKLSTHSMLISVSEFESRLMTLMSLARNSIMYLSLAIHFEERNNSIDNGLVMPRELPLK